MNQVNTLVRETKVGEGYKKQANHSNMKKEVSTRETTKTQRSKKNAQGLYNLQLDGRELLYDVRRQEIKRTYGKP